MRKKSGFIPIVIGIEQAMVLVPKFENVVSELGQQVALGDQSNSTLKNNIRRIALFVIHFGKLLSRSVQRESTTTWLLWPATPGRPRTAALNTYLPAAGRVYGLRYYYRLPGMDKNAIALPSLKKDVKLPVILNQ